MNKPEQLLLTINTVCADNALNDVRFPEIGLSPDGISDAFDPSNVHEICASGLLLARRLGPEHTEIRFVAITPDNTQSAEYNLEIYERLKTLIITSKIGQNAIKMATPDLQRAYVDSKGKYPTNNEINISEYCIKEAVPLGVIILTTVVYSDIAEMEGASQLTLYYPYQASPLAILNMFKRALKAKNY